jgi:hypothetical protein
MIKIYKANDFKFMGHDRLRRIINFSDRPVEFKEKTFVQLLTENETTMYSLKQVLFDEEKEIHYPENFAVNYGDVGVDSWPLVRGFIPEGTTLYEIMTNKKEIHIIPNPSRRLFYEEGKVGSPNTFYFEGTLDDVLKEFRSAGFRLVDFAPAFDSIVNHENRKRYSKED